MRRQEDLEVCRSNEFLSAIYQYIWVTTTKFFKIQEQARRCQCVVRVGCTERYFDSNSAMEVYAL